LAGSPVARARNGEAATWAPTGTGLANPRDAVGYAAVVEVHAHRGEWPVRLEVLREKTQTVCGRLRCLRFAESPTIVSKKKLIYQEA
jgi:hypothetical protein